jgi:hypothetical protein
MNFLTNKEFIAASSGLLEFARTAMLALLSLTLIAASTPILFLILALAIALITGALALAFTGWAFLTWDILRLLEAAGLIHGTFNSAEASYCYELFNHSTQFCTSIL